MILDFNDWMKNSYKNIVVWGMLFGVIICFDVL